MMGFDELPPFLRIDQVQDLLQLGRATVYAGVNRYFDTNGAEGIPAVRVGGSLRVPTAALARMAMIDPERGGHGTR